MHLNDIKKSNFVQILFWICQRSCWVRYVCFYKAICVIGLFINCLTVMKEVLCFWFSLFKITICTFTFCHLLLYHSCIVLVQKELVTEIFFAFIKVPISCKQSILWFIEESDQKDVDFVFFHHLSLILIV